MPCPYGMVADIVFGVLLLLFLFAGLKRGFLKLAAFAGFLVACAAGVLHLHRPLFRLFARSFKDEVAVLLSYGLIVLFAAVVFWTIGRSMRKKAEKGGLGGFDTAVGGLLGVATWALLGCLTSLHAAARPDSILYAAFRESRLDPYFRLGARRALAVLPPDARKKVEPVLPRSATGPTAPTGPSGPTPPKPRPEKSGPRRPFPGSPP